MKMKYDAFISYRHQKLDKAIAEKLQKKLEVYRPPKGIDYKNTKKINRIFRDESELPTSNDLSADIRTALEQSSYLIALCSPQFKASKWCMQEIEYFIELHGGRTNNILPILIEGNPTETFPQVLYYDIRTVTLEDGSQRKMKVGVEPLVANVSGGSMATALKKLNIEFMRIAAPILGCTFEELYSRHQRRVRSRIIKTIAAIIVAVSVFVGGLLFQNVQVPKQRDRALMNQSLALADRSRQMNSSGDKTMGLLLSIEALPKNLISPDRPYAKEAKWALFENLASEMSGMEIIDDYDYMSDIDPHKWSVESEDGYLKLNVISFFEDKYEIINTLTGSSVAITGIKSIMKGLGNYGPWRPEYVFFSKKGKYVLISGHEGVVVFISSDGKEVYRTSSGSYNAAISDDEKHLVIFDGDKLIAINLIYGTKHQEEVLVDKLNYWGNATSNPIKLVFSKDSKYLLFSTERDKLEIWEIVNNTEEYLGYSYNQIFSLQENNILTGYFTDENDIVIVYKNGNKRLIKNPTIAHLDQNTIIAGQRDISQIKYNDKENKLYVHYNNGVTNIFDANNFEMVNNDQLLDLSNNVVFADHLDNGVFLEDERVLGLITENGHLIFRDIDTDRVLAELKPPAGKYKNVILAKDRLIIQSDYNVRAIPYKTDELMLQAKEMLNGRELSSSERTSHYCEIE